ncbi:phosphoribosylamine--glycine ligase, partial [candidate division KSB1 bacterium]
TIVGPEAPLVEGIEDLFSRNGLKLFGPSKKAAEIEGSKVFADMLTKKYNIPAPEFEVFNDREKLIDYLKSKTPPFVVKADGLAGGKGVIICNSIEEGIEAADLMFVKRKFGKAGDRVLVEEFLDGEETSIFAITDGDDYVLLPSSQDHKRVFDNDEGPNTGGMGAYSPAPLVDDALLEKIKNTIINPTIDAMKKEGRPYRGVLYFGLIIHDGIPKVLEYNCRFGDPEAQVTLPLLKTDLMEVIFAVIEGGLKNLKVENLKKSATCVVLASVGYPDSYEKGKEIFGLDSFEETENELIFHAGTIKKNGKFFTNGGRVLGVTYLGDDLESSIDGVYRSVKKIKFDKMHYRKDIGQKGLKRLGIFN